MIFPRLKAEGHAPLCPQGFQGVLQGFHKKGAVARLKAERRAADPFHC